MTKTKSKETKKENPEINLDELIMNCGSKKYQELVLAMKWVYHLKESDEYKNKPASELIERALKDILSGSVTPKEIAKAIEKDEERRLERIAEKRRERAAKKAADEK